MHSHVKKIMLHPDEFVVGTVLKNIGNEIDKDIEKGYQSTSHIFIHKVTNQLQQIKKKTFEM
jgi:hypothetical protein